MATDSTAEALLIRCADGDQRAFALLYDQASPRVFGLLLKMVRRRDQAEDLLQDTFVKVWHKAGTYNVRSGRALTWIVSIARNAAIDQLRRSGRELTVNDLTALADSIDRVGDIGEANPEQAASQSQSNQRLRQCMDKLNETQRDGIKLSFLAGLSHGEVARALKAPLGTTKSWIRRGLAALKKCLAGDPGAAT